MEGPTIASKAPERRVSWRGALAFL